MTTPPTLGTPTDSPPRMEPVAAFRPIEWLNNAAEALTKGHETLLAMRETEQAEMDEIPEWETNRSDLEFNIRQQTDHRMRPIYAELLAITKEVEEQEAHWAPEQVGARALATQDASRQQATVARITRVPDHGLVAAQEQAVSANDLPTAMLILAEAQQRPSIPAEYKQRIQGLLNSLSLPGRDVALTAIKTVKEHYFHGTITYLRDVSPQQKLTWARELGLGS